MPGTTPATHRLPSFSHPGLATTLALGLLLAQPAYAEHDPVSWYVKDYAALWAGTPGEDIDKILSHYAEMVTTHNADGSIDITPREAWLKEPMAEWLAEGWMTATLQTVETDQLNEGTAVFKAKWLDKYEDGSEEYSCGWYLANHLGGRWQFTGYTDIDCEAHSL